MSRFLPSNECGLLGGGGGGGLGVLKRFSFLFSTFPINNNIQQHQQIIKSKGYESYLIDYRRDNTLILTKFSQLLLK